MGASLTACDGSTRPSAFRRSGISRWYSRAERRSARPTSAPPPAAEVAGGTHAGERPERFSTVGATLAAVKKDHPPGAAPTGALRRPPELVSLHLGEHQSVPNVDPPTRLGVSQLTTPERPTDRLAQLRVPGWRAETGGPYAGRTTGEARAPETTPGRRRPRNAPKQVEIAHQRPSRFSWASSRCATEARIPRPHSRAGRAARACSAGTAGHRSPSRSSRARALAR